MPRSQARRPRIRAAMARGRLGNGIGEPPQLRDATYACNGEALRDPLGPGGLRSSVPVESDHNGTKMTSSLLIVRSPTELPSTAPVGLLMTTCTTYLPSRNRSPFTCTSTNVEVAPGAINFVPDAAT